MKNGTTQPGLTSLVKYNNEWWYVVNGKVASNTTTLVKYNNEWYYIKNGTTQPSVTTLVKYSGDWYYVKNGTYSAATGFCSFNGQKYYVEDGMAQTNTTGKIYGFPMTNNTWFMYYNKDVFSAEDVKSLDTMLTKGKVAFPWSTGWYSGAFFFANGCTMNKTLAMQFAAFLATPASQKARYEYRGVIPAAKSLTSDPVIKQNPVAVAEINTMNNASVKQPFIPEMGQYWTPVGNFGILVANGEITKDNYKDQVAMLEEALNNTGL